MSQLLLNILSNVTLPSYPSFFVHFKHTFVTHPAKISPFFHNCHATPKGHGLPPPQNSERAPAWILRNTSLIHILTHYLDDFWTAGPANSTQCASNLARIQYVFHKLGVPIAPEKLGGPTTCITYLGIEMDSVAQVISLPPPKFHELILLLGDWSTEKKCTKRELLSLIGKLAFAAKVVRLGRLFLRSLID